MLCLSPRDLVGNRGVCGSCPSNLSICCPTNLAFIHTKAPWGARWHLEDSCLFPSCPPYTPWPPRRIPREPAERPALPCVSLSAFSIVSAMFPFGFPQRRYFLILPCTNARPCRNSSPACMPRKIHGNRKETCYFCFLFIPLSARYSRGFSTFTFCISDTLKAHTLRTARKIWCFLGETPTKHFDRKFFFFGGGRNHWKNSLVSFAFLLLWKRKRPEFGTTGLGEGTGKSLGILGDSSLGLVNVFFRNRRKRFLSSCQLSSKINARNIRGNTAESSPLPLIRCSSHFGVEVALWYRGVIRFVTESLRIPRGLTCGCMWAIMAFTLSSHSARNCCLSW